jgi:dihydrofolate reductase
MRETVLYIAMSLDGYIADSDGNIDWLTSFDARQSSYPDFLASVDTLVMGYTTYKQLTTQLSPDFWPYPDKQVYVASHQSIGDDGQALFTDDPAELLRKIKAEEGKRIWIVGGAQLAESLFSEGLIDTLILTLAPLTLGQGVPLFSQGKKNFNLIDVQKIGPFAQLTYAIEQDRPKS